MTAMVSPEYLQGMLTHNITAMPRLRFVDIAGALAAIYAALKCVQVARSRMRTTALRGPPSPSLLWGVDRMLMSCRDPGLQYEKWAEEYGGVYMVPAPLGVKRIVLCDAKAIAHMFGAEPWTFVTPPHQKIAAEAFLGKGLTTAVGEDHRRQRKLLTPGFSGAAIRNLAPVFYDNAHKAKGAWDSIIQSHGNGSALIEVQTWMNHIALDTIGTAGLSYDFGALDGKPATIEEAFYVFTGVTDNLIGVLGVFAMAIPWLKKVPTPLSKNIQKLNDTITGIADDLLTRARKEKQAGTLGEREEKSILGLLLKAESQGGKQRMTREEVTAQVKLLIFAGYETTSTSMTWALIELCKKPHVQDRLRAELLALGAEPTYDQISNGLPYLDAVVQETFRLHPPLAEFTRMATKDDIIPLGNPVKTSSGKLVDHISVAKGSFVYVSLSSMQQSTTLWGPDAREFNPDRWLAQDGIPAGAREIQGHRHLLSFLDGPRICLGRGLAAGQIKVVLAILIRNFVLEFPNGTETPIEMAIGVLPRPQVAGEKNLRVPMLVRRFE